MTDAPRPCLETRGITKTFGRFNANEQIDFAVIRGEVHGLLGENGAGKSTFVNVLSGLYHPTHGEILVDDERVSIRSPRDAIALGIGAVHQHFKLVPAFTVAENIQLGVVASPRKWGSRRRHSEKVINQFAEDKGLEIPVSATVANLSLPMQQRVEIVKILYWGSRILILDEPTAVLAPEDATALLEYLRRLASEGSTVIFISHKLEEVKGFCDRVTVLRQGRVVARREMHDVTVGELAHLMIGRDIEVVRGPPRLEPRSSSPVIEARELCVLDDRGHRAVRDASVAISSGEIMGLAGIEGNGQEELAQALYGTRPVERGTIALAGVDITKDSLTKRQEKGIRAVPSDRRSEGLILGFTLAENLALEDRRIQTGWLRPLPTRQMKSRAAQLIEGYDIRAPGVGTRAELLSGGNQQKLVLARVLSSQPRVVIAMNPFRGLDVGAANYVRECLLRERERGTAILLYSPDLDDIMTLSDRIAVISRGEIVATVSAEDVSIQRLGRLMLGADLDD